MNAALPISSIALADQIVDISAEARRVRDALIAQGLETPMTDNGLDRDGKYHRIRAAFTDIMETLGLDLRDDSLCESPHRVAKMYLDEMFAGLDYSHFPRITAIENKMGVDEMVRVSDINLNSSCEHHFVTIDGTARVAYIPGESVIGLSKINRIVQFFAARPQVQERLTRQILVALQTLLNTEHVAVLTDATHFCVKARGIRDTGSVTRCTAMGGDFLSDRSLRGEFMQA